MLTVVGTYLTLVLNIPGFLLDLISFDLTQIPYYYENLQGHLYSCFNISICTCLCAVLPEYVNDFNS